MSFSIRDKQADLIKAMLNLNRDGSGRISNAEEVWKVLVYDEECRDIIAPLLHVGDLREHGITLHLLLGAQRSAIPDVPVIYFVTPTEENVDLVAHDARAGLYDTLYVNFCGATPTPLLQRLAQQCAEHDCVRRIARVCDQPARFVAYAHDLFALNMSLSYCAFNDTRLSDQRAQANVERVVDGLFSAVVALGHAPIVRCPKNGAAEIVARALCARLYAHFGAVAASAPAGGGGGGGGGGGASFRRPVLLLLERTLDRAAMLHHAWSYEALVADVLGMSLNRVTLDVTDPDGTERRTTYDLDATRDRFWAQTRTAQFPEVAVHVKRHLEEYQRAVGEVDRLKEQQEATAEGAKELGELVTAIPELREKKRLIDMHTNIATALLKQIKSRELDRYVALEQRLLARDSVDKADLRYLLQVDSPGTPDDKLRLYIIAYLCMGDNLASAEQKQFEQQLEQCGADMRALRHIKSQPRFGLDFLPSPATASSAASASSSSSSSFFGLRKGLDSVQALAGLVSDGVDFVKSTLGSKQRDLLVTRITDAIMEQRDGKSTLDGIDKYLYFDSKLDPKVSASGSVPRKTSPFREAIVFVIGGGSVVEHDNLRQYAAGGSADGGGGGSGGGAQAKKSAFQKKSIIYGCTELMNASDFVKQLAEL